MGHKLARGSGGLCLLLIVFIMKGWWSPGAVESPALHVSGQKCLISLGNGFQNQGVYQINDACSWRSVINVTGGQGGVDWLQSNTPNQRPNNGEHFEITQKTAINRYLLRSWIPAGQRIALGVPLHPDRMTRLDWETLPGIGSKLSERIETNRQKYGEFGRLEALSRVDGISDKKIQQWAKFF